MPNWCYNIIEVDGPEVNVRSFMKEICEFRKDEQQTDLGQRPEYAPPNCRYLFNIGELYENDNTFSCDSKWAPPINTLKAMATHHNVTIVCEYDEVSNGLYGEATITKKATVDINVPWAEFQKLEEDEEGSVVYEGEEMSLYEALDSILDKQKSLKNG